MDSRKTQQVETDCIGTYRAHSDEAYPKSLAVYSLKTLHTVWTVNAAPISVPYESVPLAAGSHATSGWVSESLES